MFKLGFGSQQLLKTKQNKTDETKSVILEM